MPPNDGQQIPPGGDTGVDNPGFTPDEEKREGSIASTDSTAPQDQQDKKEGGTGEDTESLDRQQWGNPLEFLMSCIAMSVGLGNVWRFPFTAYENGGGAFLIPYIIVLVIVGKPFYYMEMVMGQFSSLGPVKVWNMVPALRGVGWAQMISTTAVVSYYCSLMAITVYYFFASFAGTLPWAYCDPDWPNCFDRNTPNGTNITVLRGAAEIYFKDVVMHEKANIDDGIGYPVWELALCLVFAWTTVFLILVKGVSGSGKVAYFLALFPYVVLIILLVRGCLLPGSGTGILYFVTPQWEKLLDPTVWYAAVGQCFFSLSVSFGPIIMYSSYNPFKHNIHRDAMIVTTMDTFTSILAGCTVFAILGNLAHERGQGIEDVVQGGSGLAFISYPETIARFDVVPQLFSVLFFLMLYTLGIGSSIALAGAVITVYCDQFPTHPRWIITSIMCGGCCAIGLVYITPGGQYILDLVDYFAGTFIIFILAIVEIIGVIWIYGLQNFLRDIRFMLGRGTSWYFKACWAVISPIFLIIILVYNLVTLEPATYGGNQNYPLVCYVLGWILFAFGIVQIPFWAAFAYWKVRKMSFRDAMCALFRPNARWGPARPKLRQQWLEFCEEERLERSRGNPFRRGAARIRGVFRRGTNSLRLSSA